MGDTSTPDGYTTGGNTTTTGGTGGSTTRTTLTIPKPDPKTPEGRYELYRALHEKPGGPVPSDLVLRVEPEKTMKQRLAELEKKLAEMGEDLAGMVDQTLEIDGFNVRIKHYKGDP